MGHIKFWLVAAFFVFLLTVIDPSWGAIAFVIAFGAWGIGAKVGTFQ